MALLELTEIPPVYYRPYYSGWNAQDTAPLLIQEFTIQEGSVKRVNIADSIPTLQNFFTDAYGFNDNNFWYISNGYQVIRPPVHQAHPYLMQIIE